MQPPKKANPQALVAAKSIGERIKSREQGEAILKAAKQKLGEAYDFTKGFRPIEFASGVLAAEWSRITAVSAYIDKVKNVRGFDRKWADRCGLAVVQAGDVLQALKAGAKKREHESFFSDAMMNLASIVKRILEKAGETAAKAMPSFGWLIVGYLAWKELGKRGGKRV